MQPLPPCLLFGALASSSPRLAFLERRTLGAIVSPDPAQRQPRVAKEMATRTWGTEDKARGVVRQGLRCGRVAAVCRCGLSPRSVAAVRPCVTPPRCRRDRELCERVGESIQACNEGIDPCDERCERL